jgi:hypothetical protein
MQSDLDPTIKTRPDGSIDTAHYMAKGRVARANQAKHLAKTLLVEKKQDQKAPGLARFWQMLMPRHHA